MAEVNPNPSQNSYELKKQLKEAERNKAAKKRFLKRASLWFPAILVIGLVVFGMIKLATSPATQSASLISAVSASDQSIGNKNSKVVLMEYSDFQCPACGAYYPLLKQLNREMGSKMLLVYRHFPLPQHAQARLTAQAAEAAGKQNKFWEMHDLLFENQNEWAEKDTAETTIISYAQKLGLNVDQFKKDLYSKEVENKVQSDTDGGLNAGVNATPTLFLNGKKIENPQSYDELKTIINQAIGNNT